MCKNLDGENLVNFWSVVNFAKFLWHLSFPLYGIWDQLDEVGVELNIPPFLNDQKQLPSRKVQEGHTIASLSCIANQIVVVCALLMNFQSILIPLSTMEESDIDKLL